MIRLYTTALFMITTGWLSAQQVLLSEDFNTCGLPEGWQVEATGNPDAIWYIGLPDNGNSDGSTIDGSCMLIFDDDATGENTPAWTVNLQSPAFDGSIWSSVRLSMDVHFRNYNGSASLQVLVNDGTNLHEVATYQGDAQTGTQFSEYVTLTADLSFFSSPSMSLVIRYDDGNDWAWWAGIDNIEIIGEGEATPVLLETFNDCNAPAGWSTSVESGDYDWEFAYVENPNATGEISSMNGSCFAFFDDDLIGQEAAPSRVTLYSPVIDGTEYARFYLDFDLILRRYLELEGLSVGVQDITTGNISWAVNYLTDMGGPQFYDYVHEFVDLTPFRSPSMRLVFQYTDGGGWGWWVGIDNIKVTAEGDINDLCENAIPLLLDADCVEGDNTFGLYTGPVSSCSNAGIGSLWYRYEAQQSGLVAVQSNAVYNDLITVFTGDCNAPVELTCTNYDEFGFTGERLLFEAESGNTYFIRLSGVRGAFGVPTGYHCVALESLLMPPSLPENDNCANSIPIEIDANCVEGNNFNASFTGPAPSLNNKSKADVWYHFQALESSPLLIQSNADFADVLTVYQGTCGALEEVACADRGQELRLDEVIAGTTYYVQLSSYFATLYGSFCLSATTLDELPAENVDCFEAISIPIDGACVEGTNQAAPFSGPSSSCDIYQDASLWYAFVAPPSGKIKLATNADFVHAVSVFQGNCNDLSEVFCESNPNTCNGDARIEGLQPGETYLLRISSSLDYTGVWETGTICLAITEPQEEENYQALVISGNVECYDNGRGKLFFYIAGGSGSYTTEGNINGEILDNGTTYVVVVRDANGCTTSLSGTVDCTPACAINAVVSVEGENECPEDYQASIAVQVEGGTPPYEYIWQNGSESASQEGVASGYYSVTITDAEGNCEAIAGELIPGPLPFDFEIIDILDVSENGNDGAIIVDFSGGEAPYTFAWLLNGEVVSENQNPTNLLAGTYTFQAMDANGCIFEYSDIIINSTTNTTDIKRLLHCQMFPNPATALVNIKWQSERAIVNTLSVYNASGQLVFEKRIEPTTNAVVLDVSAFPGACYYVRLMTSEGVWVRPLVVGK